jgi:hypothetical protein
MAEAERSLSRDVAEQNIWLTKDRQRIKEVQRLRLGEIALHDIAGQTPVLSPLHIDPNL